MIILEKAENQKQKLFVFLASVSCLETVVEWNLPILSAERKCQPFGNRLLGNSLSSAALRISLESRGWGPFLWTNVCFVTVSCKYGLKTGWKSV